MNKYNIKIEVSGKFGTDMEEFRKKLDSFLIKAHEFQKEVGGIVIFKDSEGGIHKIGE